MRLTQRPPRPQLLPIFQFRSPQNLNPFPRRHVPSRDLVRILRQHRCSIVIVPPHLCQPRSFGFGLQHGVRGLGQELDVGVPARVPAYLDPAQGGVCVWGLETERRGRFEAVDQEGGSARAVGVREEVEGLKAGWVGEVCRVGVGTQCQRGVGAVFG